MEATAGATVTVPDTLAEASAASGKTGIDRSYPADSPIRRLTVAGRSPGLKTDNRPESPLDWLAVADHSDMMGFAPDFIDQAVA